MDAIKGSIKKNAINYGLVLGAILALTTTILYAINVELLTEWWLGIIIFMLALAIGIVSVAKSKAILGGFISFKQAFTSYFITIAIGGFISVLTSILIFAVIDPGSAEYLNERVMEITQSMMERFGAPESEIEKALAEMDGVNNYSALRQLRGFLFQLAFYSVFGLLVALIMKRKDPNQA